MWSASPPQQYQSRIDQLELHPCAHDGPHQHAPQVCSRGKEVPSKGGGGQGQEGHEQQYTYDQALHHYLLITCLVRLSP
eukprot:CAMPEP_0119112908 /NCGR_PEP_ID=MMETSP1180-20130426/42184_1 /TAXON_ID=3052 ORGANISM="Chlamydomonas cf sp, Strain CCMP681" /NCGR_SAMPLE_ID=MMETSP1180 /ASSEMBLY_ACC=CAM_ASM_000741 /LENGTH=78 /DNA_ID=CAMNT_0007100685 /DNA_START=323 /DNA_END=559 /DNA_ORIENTATION=+